MSRASWSSSDEEDGQEGVEVIENEDGSCQEAEHDTVRLLKITKNKCQGIMLFASKATIFLIFFSNEL